MEQIDDIIKEAATAINNADAVLISAGAGIGVDSGLPDFRGNRGFWNAYPPYEKLGLSFVEMANPAGFETDPQFAWGFYGHRLNLYRKTIPHSGFKILLDIAGSKEDYFVFTSNVDGQFQVAGFDPEKIEECHGSIHHLQCINSSCNNLWESRDVKLEIDQNTMRAMGELPQCPACSSLARPNILMFGDWDWISDRTNLQHERFLNWRNSLDNKKTAIIECGAGTAVPTVRYISEKILSRYNATLIRINVRDPQVPAGQIGIAAGAEETLKKIFNLM
ncbi:MAG: Sir2 family NAD-dependent protein deacetylase [Acidobacteriota bacterium]